MDSTPEYLTKPHAAAIFDLKVRALENAVRAGQIRAFKIGKKVLLERASIDEWIRSHEITAATRAEEKSELARKFDRVIAEARRRTA